MDKKIGNILNSLKFNLLFLITLFFVEQIVFAKSMRVMIQNSQQQVIQEAEIGIPFLIQLFVDDIEPRDQPKGFEQAQNCIVQMYGTTQSSSYVNGKKSQRIIFTYVVTPDKKGILELGPVTVVDKDGTEIQSEVIRVPVGDIAEPEYRGKQPYVLVTDVDQKSVYIGQKVTVFLRFCYMQGFEELSIENSPIRGAHSGYQEQNWQQSTIKLGDYEYSCKQIYFELYPQELGTVVVPQFKATFMPENSMQQGMSNLFSLFGFSGAKLIQSHPRAIEVKPLPESAQYSGVTAIGTFHKISFTLNQKKGQVGEGIVAKMTVEGDGNLEVAKAPQLIVPDGLQFYEGNSSVQRIDQKLSRKTFEWILQAQGQGTYTIPAQQFTYFDLTTQSYKQLCSGEVTLTVEGVTQQKQQINEQESPIEPLQQETEIQLSSSVSDEVTYVQTMGLSSSSGYLTMLSEILAWLICALVFVLVMIIIGRWLKPYLFQTFFVQSLYYRWLFWKYCRQKNIQAVYQLFEELSVRYGFGLQSRELQKCFHDLNLLDETFSNWKNFVAMLWEFNFTTKKTEEDTALAFHLAKQWFPIILSCCKLFHKKAKAL